MANLKQLRQEKQLTQEQVADYINEKIDKQKPFTRQSVQAYESGTIKPRVEIAKILGELYEIDWSLIYD